MKTKTKIKTRKHKGGHKVHYDYDTNIAAGTNKPLTGKYVHKNNCTACALYSLGFMTKDTARYLQRMQPDGLKIQTILDIINDTYGPGHKFINYKSAQSLQSYLQAGEATIGIYGGIEPDGFDWGHTFIVFHAKNGILYSIDSQVHTVSLLRDYLSNIDMKKFYLLTEPPDKSPVQKFITVETINRAIAKNDAS
jgi:hypothetical protein